MYKHWKGTIEPENGYNGIDSVVGIGGLLLNAVTIYFVYITYQQQRKQIEEQNEQLAKSDKEAEFNRLLDIIYKQLDHTRFKYNADAEELFKISTALEVCDMPEIMKNLKNINNAMRALNYEGNFYAQIIERCGLNNNDRAYLYNIYNNNVPEHYVALIYNLSDFGESYAHGDEFKEKFDKEYLDYYDGAFATSNEKSITGVLDLQIEKDREKMMDKVKDEYTNFMCSLSLSAEIVERNQYYGEIFDKLN
ncbi:hypothetical protein GCM10017764_29480 [Sphingobacterium griseoflavum]|uniref:Phage abortive infection protein n=1 Tax=Sphingobacterium griseoflavum TaxID=1474952 RepID=A0ABQ3I187_9SPHI|nr:hypothetical protein GCM10017764_29480 [Sphingobacterium griseoflavum]